MSDARQVFFIYVLELKCKTTFVPGKRRFDTTDGMSERRLIVCKKFKCLLLLWGLTTTCCNIKNSNTITSSLASMMMVMAHCSLALLVSMGYFWIARASVLLQSVAYVLFAFLHQAAQLAMLSQSSSRPVIWELSFRVCSLGRSILRWGLEWTWVLCSSIAVRLASHSSWFICFAFKPRHHVASWPAKKNYIFITTLIC